MTIYVDSADISATVRNVENGQSHTSSWCHLFSDSLKPTELHAFAKKIGLRRSWFQHEPTRPMHDHYDVTAGKRRQAVAAGAIEVNRHQAVAIWRSKRDKFLTLQGRSAPGVSCRTVEVDGEQVSVKVRGPRGAAVTDADRLRFLRDRPAEAPE